MFFYVATVEQGVQRILYCSKADVRAKLHDVGLCDLADLAVKHSLHPVWLAHTYMTHVLNPVLKFILSLENDAQVIFHERKIVVLRIVPFGRAALQGLVVSLFALLYEHLH